MIHEKKRCYEKNRENSVENGWIKYFLLGNIPNTCIIYNYKDIHLECHMSERNMLCQYKKEQCSQGTGMILSNFKYLV